MEDYHAIFLKKFVLGCVVQFYNNELASTPYKWLHIEFLTHFGPVICRNDKCRRSTCHVYKSQDRSEWETQYMYAAIYKV